MSTARRTTRDLDTDDLNLSNLQYGQPGEDSEMGRIRITEELQREMYNLQHHSREDEDVDQDSIGYGDLDDVESPPRRREYDDHRKQQRTSSSNASSSSSEDFDTELSMKLGQQRGRRTYSRDVMSEDDEEDRRGPMDDLTIGTIISGSPTLSPRRPPIIVASMASSSVPVATAFKRTSPTSAFDQLAKGFKTAFSSAAAVSAMDLNDPATLPRGKSMGKGMDERNNGVKRAFGSTIGNVVDNERRSYGEGVGVKENDGKKQPLMTTTTTTASSRSALPARPISTIYGGPTRFARSPLAPPNPNTTSTPAPSSSRTRPSSSRLADENTRPSLSSAYASSTPLPRVPNNSERSTTHHRSVEPDSPLYNYSQQARANAFKVGQQDQADESFDQEYGRGTGLLPDITGLTMGLRSPEKPRGHIPIRMNSAVLKPIAEVVSESDGQHIRSDLANVRQAAAAVQTELASTVSQVEALTRINVERAAREEQLRWNSAEETRKSRLRDEDRAREADRLRTELVETARQLQVAKDKIAEASATPGPSSPTTSAFTPQEFRSLRAEVREIYRSIHELADEVAKIKECVVTLRRESERMNENEARRSARTMRDEGVQVRFDPTVRRRESQLEEGDDDRTPRASRFTTRESHTSPSPAPTRFQSSSRSDNYFDARPSAPSTRPSTAPPTLSQNQYHARFASALPSRSYDDDNNGIPSSSRHDQHRAEQEAMESRAQKVFSTVSASSTTACRTCGTLQALPARTSVGTQSILNQKTMRDEFTQMEDEEVVARQRQEREMRAEEREYEGRMKSKLEVKEREYKQQQKFWQELSNNWIQMDISMGMERMLVRDHLHQELDVMAVKGDQLNKFRLLVATLHSDPSASSTTNRCTSDRYDGPVPARYRREEGII